MAPITSHDLGMLTSSRHKLHNEIRPALQEQLYTTASDNFAPYPHKNVHIRNIQHVINNSMKSLHRIKRGITGVGISSILLVGCSTDVRNPLGAGDGEFGGTLVIATAADADRLFPPLVATSQGRAVTELIFDHLATVGDKLNVIGDEGFVPELAESWNWSKDSLNITFSIDKDAKWHDGTDVTATDVIFSYATYTNPELSSAFAPLLKNIDSVIEVDPKSVRIVLKEKQPMSFFDAAAQMLILPKHIYGSVPAGELSKSPILDNPVGSGRFKFRKRTPNVSLELVSDLNNYRGRAKLDRVILNIVPDFATASLRLLSGEADLYESMNADLLKQINEKGGIKVVTYPGFDYGFLMFNLKDTRDRNKPHPVFSDVRVRKALSMAVDRSAIVSNILDTLGYVSMGPMLRAMPTTDTSIKQIPYDPALAAALLDSAGWKLNKAGVRERNGKPLKFTLITPNSSRNRVQSATIIQEQLRKIGVTVDIQQLEASTFFSREMAFDFDAAMHAWSLDANPANIVQTWGTNSLGDNANSNYSGYSNPKFDSLIETALRASNLPAAKSDFTKAYQIIVDDAPAIWIYEMKGGLGVHNRVEIPAIRPDAWWTHLADWYIPKDKRIERDKIPAAGNK